ncbi:MAG: HigA family addiction module antidote protein [Polyangiaceae bacterium]|nr:HigA family addiction module antidote protein [Polyangiaceae bacterium]
MDDNLMPARAVPPGRILRRELEARGWTQKDLAEILGRPAQAITEIVRGAKQITPETAVALGAALGTSPEFWSNLESNYRLALAQQHPSGADEVTRKARLYEWVPVGELVKRGWVSAGETVADLERSVCSFLGVEKVGDEPSLVVNLRQSTQDGIERAAQRAWVKRVEHLARAQSVGPFEPTRLLAAIPTLVRDADSIEAVSGAPTALNGLGIRFVVVPHLPRTKLDGAAAFTSGGPVVALTMRYDRIDYFWFTLLHELAHLALAHEGGHLDGEADPGTVDAEETQANALAAGWLLRDADVRDFAVKHRRKPSRAAIELFAQERGVHPGIVVGRLHHLEVVPYTHFRQMLVKVRHLLEPWTDGFPGD